MQIAARSTVYGSGGERLGRVVFLAEAEDDTSALIIEARVLESNLLEFPDLQGATVNLLVRDGEMPMVTKDQKVIALLNGEASHFHRTDAARHYIELCQESEAPPPEQ